MLAFVSVFVYKLVLSVFVVVTELRVLTKPYPYPYPYPYPPGKSKDPAVLEAVGRIQWNWIPQDDRMSSRMRNPSAAPWFAGQASVVRYPKVLPG